jgi:hypothetical protein
MTANLNGQGAEHFPIYLNRGRGIAFHPHPVGDLNAHAGIKTDKSTGKRRKLPQSNYRPTSPEEKDVEF